MKPIRLGSYIEPTESEPLLEFEKNFRILVVEDEPNILENYKEILCPPNVVPITRSSRSKPTDEGGVKAPTQFKFEVTLCKNAENAMAAVQQSLRKDKPFAMGFFDVLLGPGSDGISLVKEIFALDPNMYAVFVTAYQDRNVNSINELLGEENSERWSYLNKPFSEGEIVQKARQNVSHWNLKAIKHVQDQKLAEAQKLLHAGERSSSVAAVSRGVAHEFGNIMTNIMGQADLGQRGDEKRKTDALKIILTACNTAIHVLDRFKNLAKPRKPEKSVVWAHTPFLEATRLVEHQFKTTDVKLCRIKVEKFQVKASHSSLVQVFVNIFVNAMHAMNGPGQIDFSISKDGDFGVFQIRDYGPGIPEDIIDRITEPFFTTKGDKGTGLGLSICKDIIENEHNGEFKIENHANKGAVVTIRLPINSSEGGT
jgi:signal transduction histidine kinase